MILRAILKVWVWFCTPNPNPESFGRQLALVTAVILIIFSIVLLIDVILPAMR